MEEQPFSSCCGMLWIKYKQARGDLSSFARTTNYPPSPKQLAKLEHLKQVRDETRAALAEHQAD